MDKTKRKKPVRAKQSKRSKQTDKKKPLEITRDKFLAILRRVSHPVDSTLDDQSDAELADLPAQFEADKIYVRCSDGEYKDISLEVAAVIEHELSGKFSGEGWRDFVFSDDDSLRIAPDMIVLAK